MSEGHPDKIADQISDAVLDAILAQDKRARVACETLVTAGPAISGLASHHHRRGSTSKNWPARSSTTSATTIREVGFTATPAPSSTCWASSRQNRQGVDNTEKAKKPEDTGAGDQGLMFGYACNETPEFMPAPIYDSHRLVEQQAQVRKEQAAAVAAPHAKSQMTLALRQGGKPVWPRRRGAVHPARPGHQAEGPDRGRARRSSMPVLPRSRLDALPEEQGARQPDRPLRHRLPAGRLRPDRPQDHRRHLRRHGPPTAAARSPARIRRRSTAGRLRCRATSAKNIVAAGLADSCQVQVAYAIGVAQPELELGRHVRHRQGRRRRSKKLIPHALRPAPERASSGCWTCLPPIYQAHR